MKKITLDMTIAEVLKEFPETADTLADNFNVGCLGCLMAEEETLEEGAEHHDVDPDKLLKELNKKISKLPTTNNNH